MAGHLQVFDAQAALLASGALSALFGALRLARGRASTGLIPTLQLL